LPTEGVYHPDHPGIEYEDLLETHDPEKPTVAVWFYESHWTHENTRYVDAQVRALEEQGANALPIFCNPATDTDEQEDAEWVTDNWLIADDGNSIVDAVLVLYVLLDGRAGRSADDEGVLLKTSSSIAWRTGPPDGHDDALAVALRVQRYGRDGLRTALSVALPEFDGNVITHPPISGKERTDDEAGIGSAPKHHFPIEDRIDHATRIPQSTGPSCDTRPTRRSRSRSSCTITRRATTGSGPRSVSIRRSRQSIYSRNW